MKRLLTMKNLLIAIAFTVLMLFIKDNITSVFVIIGVIFTILTPFFIGFLFAYILNFPYKLLYNRAFKNMGKKHKTLKKIKKPVALITTYVFSFAVVISLVVILIPQIINNISNLVKNTPQYAQTANNYLQYFIDWVYDTFNYKIVLEFTPEQLFSNVLAFFAGGQNISMGEAAKIIVDNLSNILSTATVGIYNFIMGVVISVYFLAFKEQLCHQVKKFAVAFIPIKYLPKIYEIVDITDTKCGRFLVGDILDSALLGLVLFVCMSIFGLPYAPLIAVLCGLCNIIPFFGPWIGSIPSALILLLVDPKAMIIFIIIIFILQQIDANVSRPKIIGNQVGLSSFWVLFSVLVGGALFGLPGFIFGTPIYAVIYSLLGKKARNKLEKKGKIAQEALDFKVLNYAEIAEEQRRIREEKELEQKKKLKKLIHLNLGDKNGEDDSEENNKDNNSDE